MPENSANHYEVLQVSRNADQREIKKAFRVLAKRYHPDRNPENPGWAAERMKRIMHAYRVLADERERAAHDAWLRQHATPTRRTEEAGRASAAADLLRELLAGRGDRALKIYDQLGLSSPASLFVYMTVRDYLDCIFLLAEQLERARRYDEAAALYEELYREEAEPPRQRYFFEELCERLKNLYVRRLARARKTPAEKLACYEKLLTFDLDRSSQAFVYKKMAEATLEGGDEASAREMLRKALALRPTMKGISKIVARLGGGQP